VQAVRAPWTSSSFQLYAGGIVVAVATGALLGALAADYGDAAFVGWAALALLVLGGLAFAARARERPLAAGLFAVSAVIVLAVLVGAIEDWFGWLAHTDTAFAGFHLSHFAIELTLLVGAIAARRVFRLPLFVLISTVAAWFFVTDLISNGGNWSAAVTLVFGLTALLVGIGADRVFGFWLQVVAGLTIGGALLTFWHSSDTDWILIGLASAAFVLIASGLGRSSYAVLAAIGLFLTTTHFVLKWFGPKDVGFFSAGEPGRPWAAALSYALYGVVLMLIGMWLARRRAPAEPV
jgi:hypothetical protein